MTTYTTNSTETLTTRAISQAWRRRAPGNLISRLRDGFPYLHDASTAIYRLEVEVHRPGGYVPFSQAGYTLRPYCGQEDTTCNHRR